MFIFRASFYLRRMNLDQSATFVMDSAPARPDGFDIIDFCSFKVIFLPPNTTSNFQPMNQWAIVLSERAHLRQSPQEPPNNVHSWKRTTARGGEVWEEMEALHRQGCPPLANDCWDALPERLWWVCGKSLPLGLHTTPSHLTDGPLKRRLVHMLVTVTLKLKTFKNPFRFIGRFSQTRNSPCPTRMLSKKNLQRKQKPCSFSRIHLNVSACHLNR